ncbi:MAG: hypothetical protein HIU82_13855 [Proteobacteria bacterium]|nr:hypothetical protein [Pseudomonadota bacterium]
MADLTQLPLVHQTMFAELAGRCMDAAFDEQFPENGSFMQVAVKGRSYWYYAGYRPQPDAAGRDGGNGATARSRLYVGPVDDPEITSRIARFATIKTDYRERRSMVRSLVAAGLPSPPGLVGDVTEALWKAGLFRLRGVLIGTLAFQTYGGFLGMRMPGAAIMTGDADFAQFHAISRDIGDRLPPIMEVLCAVDPTFAAVPHLGDTLLASKFRNDRGFEVEFLTPNRGSGQRQGRPVPMPALGGAGAAPMRYLDFLLRSPVRSVLLHKGGVPVNVPAPERYAVHKLIVATQRRGDDNGRQKARKDLVQAGVLIEALALERRSEELGLAWMEAWARGPRWVAGLTEGMARLDIGAAAILRRAVIAACAAEGRTAADFGHPG